MRDIQHEQIQESANGELDDRLAALELRYGRSGYPLAQLSELHAIRDEIWRRAYSRAKQRKEVA